MANMATRLPRDDPRWPQDDPEMTPRWPQGDPKMVLSPKSRAHFAKLAMHRLPSPLVTLKWPKMGQSNPRMAPRWPKIAPKWSQDGLKVTPEWCSRVGEVQILLNRLCRRRSSLREGSRGPKVTRRGPKMSQDRPETAQDGPKMAPRWSQDGLRATPQWCSRVGGVQILLNRRCRRKSAPQESKK